MEGVLTYKDGSVYAEMFHVEGRRGSFEDVTRCKQMWLAVFTLVPS